MKKIKNVLVLILVLSICFALSACAKESKRSSSGIEDDQSTTSSNNDTKKESGTEKETEEKNQTNAEKESSEVKPSPDKYTQYVDDYTGMNANSIGYTSLGGERLIKLGAGHLKIDFITPDGEYIDINDEESLKQYVITGQSPAPNTEVKLVFLTNSEGQEYSNLVDYQTIENIDLVVKKTGGEDNNVDLVEINACPDKYTRYVRSYIGKNLGNVGYISMGGDLRDSYGNGTLELIPVSDDGSYIDIADEEVLKQYVITGQSLAPNTEIKYEFLKNGNGEEYNNLVDFQNYESITLNVKYIGSGEPSERSSGESQEPASESSEDAQESEAAAPETESDTPQEDKSSASNGEYEKIYNEYSAMLKTKTQTLIQEYKSESAGKEYGDKAKICTSKISELAKLETEGTTKMAKVYYNAGGDYDEYSDWASKLYEVYEEQASLITEEYMNSFY